jgi:hypothetical protein
MPVLPGLPENSRTSGEGEVPDDRHQPGRTSSADAAPGTERPPVKQAEPLVHDVGSSGAPAGGYRLVLQIALLVLLAAIIVCLLALPFILILTGGT